MENKILTDEERLDYLKAKHPEEMDLIIEAFDLDVDLDESFTNIKQD